MGYLGRQPGAGVRSVFVYTATGGETSLSGSDDNNRILTYSDARYVDVVLNGSTLVRGSGNDFTATTGNSIDNLEALDADDVAVIYVYDTFGIANHYTKDEVDVLLDTAGATGGGTDNVFFENDQSVTSDYTISSGKNAMSAGDITIENGVTVTVPSGSRWVIV